MKQKLGLLLAVVLSISSVVPAYAYNMSFLYGGTPYQYNSYVERAENILNSVSPDFFKLKADGSLELNNIDKDFITNMQSKNIAVIPYLTNNSSRVLGMSALNNYRGLAISIANAVSEYDLDGINIELSNLTENSKKDHIDFINEVRHHMGDKTLIVSVAANPENKNSGRYGSYDYKEIGKAADYVLLSCFNNTEDEANPGPIANQDFITKSVENLIKHVPNEKIILGIPLYGRFWQESIQSAGHNITGMDIESLAKNYKTEKNSGDDFEKLTLTIGENDVKPKIWGGYVLEAGKYEIYRDSEIALNEKLDIVKKYDLKGVATWSLGQETQSVWNAFDKAESGDELVDIAPVFISLTGEIKDGEFVDNKEYAERVIKSWKTEENFDENNNRSRIETITIETQDENYNSSGSKANNLNNAVELDRDNFKNNLDSGGVRNNTQNNFGNNPSVGSMTGNFGNAPNAGGVTGNFGNTPNAGGATGNFGNAPNAGGATGNFGNTPNAGGATGNFGNTPNVGGVTGNFGNAPNTGGVTGNFGNAPNAGGATGNFGNAPNAGGATGNFGNTPNTGGVTGNFGNTPNAGGTTGNFGNAPNAGGVTGNFGNIPNAGGVTGNVGNAPNTRDDSTTSNFGNSSSPSFNQTSPFSALDNDIYAQSEIQMNDTVSDIDIDIDRGNETGRGNNNEIGDKKITNILNSQTLYDKNLLSGRSVASKALENKNDLNSQVKSENFASIKSHLIDKGYITENEYYSNDTLTRGQFIKTIMRMAKDLSENPKTSYFTDISDYSDKELIERAKHYGIIEINELNFYPNENITKSEVVLTLERLFELPDTVNFHNDTITDINRQENSELFYTVNKYHELGLIEIDSMSRFNPDSFMSTDEFLKIAYKIKDNSVKKLMPNVYDSSSSNKISLSPR